MNIEIEQLLEIDHWLAPEKLSGERCEAIIAECEGVPQEHINVTHTDDGVERIGRNVNAASVRTPWIHSMAVRYAAIANEQCDWHLFVDRVESMYCVYHQGQFCGWHTDGYGIHLPGRRSRKLSVGIQLSDPADYAGGAFELERPTGPRSRPESVRVNEFSPRGSIIVFPGTVVHQITPVVRGVRRSLVVWFTGPRSGDGG